MFNSIYFEMLRYFQAYQYFNTWLKEGQKEAGILAATYSEFFDYEALAQKGEAIIMTGANGAGKSNFLWSVIKYLANYGRDLHLEQFGIPSS